MSVVSLGMDKKGTKGTSIKGLNVKPKPKATTTLQDRRNKLFSSKITNDSSITQESKSTVDSLSPTIPSLQILKFNVGAADVRQRLAQGYYDLDYMSIASVGKSNLSATETRERMIYSKLESSGIFTIDVKSFLQDSLTFKSKKSA